ncbi:MAG: dihydropteroate synthase [Akkermansiaceae bacterium]|nr:dihydropteroate synthase [Akkermansiaceae bacterium]
MGTTRIWRLRREVWRLPEEGAVMGILNVTPDSFSDGGAYPTAAAAAARAEAMLAEGADVIDIGGESTRPGAREVSPEEEMRRVLPVIRALRKAGGMRLSIDTRHPEVARAALEAGADIVNDVAGLRAPGMAELCAEYGCGVIVMHMKGEPETMQRAPAYADVAGEVRSFFEERLAALTACGINPDCICWDPGPGFGKTAAHNLRLLAELDALRVADRPIMSAISRKRFLGTLLNSPEKGRSALATVTLSLFAAARGADIHRVHEPGPLREALTLWQRAAQHTPSSP